MSTQSIAIVTDSTADVPKSLAEELNIEVVANTIVLDGQSKLDEINLSREEFYDRLPQLKQAPTTATASSGIYEELYTRLIEQGAESIISIHPSSLFSGVFNAAHLAAQAFGDRVHVFDSAQVTLGLGFQVMEAAEAVRRGLGVERVVQMLMTLRDHVRVVAMLDTLEYVRRSGRVGWARARLGDLLHIKPFLEIRTGQILSLGEARTRHKGIERLVELLHHLGPLERLAMVHTNAEADARQLLEYAAPQVASQPLIVNVTTVIGAHAGPNAIGFAALPRQTGLSW